MKEAYEERKFAMKRYALSLSLGFSFILFSMGNLDSSSLN